MLQSRSAALELGQHDAGTDRDPNSRPTRLPSRLRKGINGASGRNHRRIAGAQTDKLTRKGSAIPNLIAYGALAVWPAITIFLFVTMPAYRALIWSVLAAYMLLPVNTVIDLPGIPPFDKYSVSNISIAICCLFFVPINWARVLNDRFILILSTGFVLSPFLTAYFNPEPLIYAQRFIPPMSMYDALAQAAENVIILIPFVTATDLINNEERRAYLIRTIMVGVLIYSIPMLIEIRLSPQLHRWVYGYFPHSFGQQIRDGGFRPVVFLGHGLLVAIFCAMGAIAALSLWRSSPAKSRQAAGLAAIYLFAVLIMCRSLGATALAVAAGIPIVLLQPSRLKLVAAVGCFLVLSYPIVRASGLLPLTDISRLTDSYSSDRAASFAVRVDNEDQLMRRAAVKPLVGWGSWGRNRLYSPEDGRDLSITDGSWIISYSSWGWIGYLSMFGLLCIPAIRVCFYKQQHGLIYCSYLSVILLVNLLDSVPNSSIRPFTWLVAGALSSAVLARNRRHISGNRYRARTVEFAA